MTSNAARTPEPNWIPDTSTLGARLALVRWKMGWNVAEAERECGITQNSWAGWEDGASPRKFVEKLTSIHWATGVNLMWLMTGEGSPEARTTDYGADDSSMAPVIPIFPTR